MDGFELCPGTHRHPFLPYKSRGGDEEPGELGLLGREREKERMELGNSFVLL